MTRVSFSIIIMKSRIKSFGFAFEGLQQSLKEPNMRIHCIAAAAVVIAGFMKELNTIQWMFVIVSITSVIATEIINTCIEKLCDLYVGKTFHPKVKIIKDMAAAGVLVVSITSSIIGVIIFIS